VTSMGRPSERTVTVPCSRPVGITLRKAFCTWAGTALVATSQSLGVTSRTRSRTQPPTRKARCPSPWRRSTTALTSGGTAAWSRLCGNRGADMGRKVTPAWLEHATYGLGNRRSIQLSYGADLGGTGDLLPAVPGPGKTERATVLLPPGPGQASRAIGPRRRAVHTFPSGQEAGAVCDRRPLGP